jgi:DNA-binding NtrC family response regulator
MEINHQPIGARRKTERSRLERRNILIVDEDLEVTAFVRQALHPDFDVVAASTAELARERLAADDFDLVILGLDLSANLFADVLPAGVKRPNYAAPMVILTVRKAKAESDQRATIICSERLGNLNTLVKSVRSLLAMFDRPTDNLQEARDEAQGAVCG